MEPGLTWLTLLSVALATIGLYYARTARATPANLFKGTTIAVGRFDEFDVFNQFSNNDLPSGFPANVWISLQKTKGPSDLYVQCNTWQPDGSIARPTVTTQRIL